MIQAVDNPDIWRCSECKQPGICEEIKFPPVKEIIERGYSIQRMFGLNTREIKARIRTKGGKSSGRYRRQKKVAYVRKPLDL